MSELDANYAAAGFHAALDPGTRPALLLVDMVRAYLEPESPLYAAVESTLAPAAAVLAAARAAGIPVVYTQVRYAEDGRDGGIFFRKVPALAVFAGDHDLGRIAPEVAPEPGDTIVVKQYASAFFGTSLSSTLTALRIDTVIVMGYSTSGCVRASAVDALQFGFIPLVVRDAVGDRHPDPHHANLFDLAAKYADVWQSHRVVDYLSTLPKE
ncbi:isochorismatase family protein [Paractinoplanes rhizophilus]|jgi:maleamate amidohydrolase|uniref:Isochorismatase family protein n=1 Tax=Paractinoplanes rhizophilus TaxID=1416877 RepID=A0ABW2HYC4_9ACTN|nr:isochorismatase family protein [Actinoplanes sp.]